MGYLFNATEPAAAKALEAVKALLLPGKFVALVGSYHGESYSALVSISPAGQWEAIGVGGTQYVGQQNALAIVAGLIGAAVFHGGQVSYAVNTGQWNVLIGGSRAC